MRYSIAIAGILPAWPIGEIEVETSSLEEQSRRRLESAHAGMRTRKSTDSQRIDTSSYSENADMLDFDALYEKFKIPIHSYIYRLLGSQEDADDIAQEVFTRAYTIWNDLYDRANLSSLLYRIATNLCIDLLRRRKRISWWPLMRAKRSDDASEFLGDEEALYLPSDDGGISRIGEQEHIRRTLASMPHDYAIVLVLSAAQGVPYQEIAEIVGISPNATATRISRAKRMFVELYQRLSEERVGGKA
jgi:RNA polymerase sigma-70 factor (ECF subfamily)